MCGFFLSFFFFFNFATYLAYFNENSGKIQSQAQKPNEKNEKKKRNKKIRTQTSTATMKKKKTEQTAQRSIVNISVWNIEYDSCLACVLHVYQRVQHECSRTLSHRSAHIQILVRNTDNIFFPVAFLSSSSYTQSKVGYLVFFRSAA